jgi:preprotein translocase subunit SecA
MSKKKTASSKATRVKPAAANPVRTEDVARPAKAANAAAVSSAAPARAPFRRPQTLNFAGVGRNDICPCGSGKRFKNCHGH